MSIFRFKSAKIYTGQKNLHKYIRGSRDKYEVWIVCLETAECTLKVKKITGKIIMKSLFMYLTYISLKYTSSRQNSDTTHHHLCDEDNDDRYDNVDDDNDF